MNITEHLPENAKIAIVIIIKTNNDTARYFSELYKGKIVKAWSLSGAKLFYPNNPELERVEKILKIEKYKFERHKIGLINN